MEIDYVPPEHWKHSHQQFLKGKGDLEEVLNDKPWLVLGRIAEPWPFELDVRCTLGGLGLGCEHDVSDRPETIVKPIK